MFLSWVVFIVVLEWHAAAAPTGELHLPFAIAGHLRQPVRFALIDSAGSVLTTTEDEASRHSPVFKFPQKAAPGFWTSVDSKGKKPFSLSPPEGLYKRGQGALKIGGLSEGR